MNAAVNGAWLEKLSQTVPLLVKLLAVAWVVWLLAAIVWLLSGHDASRLPHVSVNTTSAQPRIDTAKLASFDLFGQPLLSASTASEINAPDTTLQLKLNGVFVSATPEQSSAIISQSSPNSAKLFRVNDALPGGAVLEAVFEDRILLKRGEGSSEVLRFAKTSLLESSSATVNKAASSSTQRINANSVLGLIDQASAALQNNPDVFLQNIGVVRTGSGYVLGPTIKEDLLKSSGLKKGDRIVSINGHRLGDLDRDSRALAQLKNQGGAVIEIQRGSQTLTINQKF